MTLNDGVKEYLIYEWGDENEGAKTTIDIYGVNVYENYEGQGYNDFSNGAVWGDLLNGLIECMVDLNHTANPYSNILITQIEDVLKTYKKVMDWENE